MTRLRRAPAQEVLAAKIADVIEQRLAFRCVAKPALVFRNDLFATAVLIDDVLIGPLRLAPAAARGAADIDRSLGDGIGANLFGEVVQDFRHITALGGAAIIVSNAGQPPALPRHTAARPDA